MVDFQSRDTRRGPTDEDDEDDDTGESSNDEAATTEAESEAADSAANDGTDSRTEASNDAIPGAATGDATADNASEQATQAESTPTADSGDAEPPTDGSVTEKIDEAASARSETEETAPPHPQGTDDGPTQEHQPERSRPPSESDEVASETGGTAEQTTSTADTAQKQQVAVAVVTVGTATEEGDPTGEAVETALEATGQTVTARERLRGDYDSIQGTVDRLVERDDVGVVVTAGGLGVAPTEHTLEAVHPLFEKALPGFEEVYRSLLFEQRGTGVIAVRATAGIADGTPVFCLPAEPAAARLGIEEIIAAEAQSLVAELP
jgi:molybdenum cofactor biosynthesis protein B